MLVKSNLVLPAIITRFWEPWCLQNTLPDDVRALYNTIHWSFSSCNLSRSHSFPLGLYQPTCDPRSKSRPRNWKQTHERTRSPRYLDVNQRFFISIPKTWSSHVFILQSFSNLCTSHYILKETLCLNVRSKYWTFFGVFTDFIIED